VSALPFLSDAEIFMLCEPLEQPAAQVRYLKRLGLVVNRKPNGRPLVARGEFERVTVGRQHDSTQNQSSTGQPNIAALLQVIRGGRHHGSQAQRQ
jgi:hypothetical protein